MSQETKDINENAPVQETGSAQEITSAPETKTSAEAKDTKDKKGKLLRKNLIYSISYQVLVIILPLITAPYAHRVLGVDNIGIHSYTQSIAHIFQAFALLGMKNYGTRIIARIRDDKEQLKRAFWSVYTVQLAVSLLVVLIYVGYVLVLVRENRLIAIIQTLYVMIAVADISWFFFGIEKFKITVLRNFCIKLATTISIFIFVRVQTDLWKYTLIILAGSLLGQLSVWPYIKRHLGFVRPTVKDCLVHLKPLLILFIPAIAVNVYKYMDKVMIGLLSSKYETGLYESAEKIVRIPNSIIMAVATVLLSRSSNIMAGDESSQMTKFIRTSMLANVWAGSAMSFGIFAIAPMFTVVFFGSEFAGTAPVLELLGFTVIAISIANVVRTQYLLPRGMDKFYTMSVIVGAVLNVVMNWIFIPHFGAVGAVFGTLSAEYGVMLIQCIYARKDLKYWQYFLDSFPFLLIGGAMALLGRFILARLKTSVPSVVIIIAVCGVFYLALSGAYLLFFKKDLVLPLLKAKKKKKKS